jgi:flagellar hook-associated protein 1 FlgK
MSLFGSIQLAGNTLRAMQVGLHVVGNNIANANTPGYIREEAIFAPAPIQNLGNLTLGLGVQVDSIVQKVDQFLLERLRNARSDSAGAEVQNKAYKDLEGLLGELTSNDVSTSLTGFFNSITEVLKSPSDAALRNLVVLTGKSLTQDINRLAARVEQLRSEFDSRIADTAGQINTLAEEVRILNVRIATAEGGGATGSDAGALRTQRQNALDELAQLIDVRVSEQPSGGVTVHVGGEFLVFEGQRREVEVVTDQSTNPSRDVVQFVDTDSPLQISGGELHGRYAARDEIVGALATRLDEFAAALAWEFNRLHSQGQGLTGFQSLTSHSGVTDAGAALDAAGLPFTPGNGAFDIIVRNKTTGDPHTHTIPVNLLGLDGDSSLSSLAAELNAIDGISATVSAIGKLTIGSDSSDTEFAFANDTSGFLAAIGLNTFFTGSSARDLGVNAELSGVENANKFAASLGGIGEDSANAVRLAAFVDQPLDSRNGATLSDLYDQLVNEVAQGSTVASSVAEGFRVFEVSLEGEHQAISGVSLDEEAIRMISLQRTYQASARLIQTISELMDVLVNL